MENKVTEIANQITDEAIEKIGSAIIKTSDTIADNFGTTTDTLLGYAVDGVRIEGVTTVLLAIMINVTILLVFKKIFKISEGFKSIKSMTQSIIIVMFVSILTLSNFILYDGFKNGVVASLAPEYSIMKMVGSDTYKALTGPKIILK